MGNTIGSGRDRMQSIKVMKITGETLKFKPPVEAGEILKDHPGLVLLESELVKHHGMRANPLGSKERLEPGRLYFLVELPEEPGVPRRVRSWVNMSAKDRLESLMLARRSASDLSSMARTAGAGEEAGEGSVRVRVRLPKAEVERLMKESRDKAEAAEKIIRAYLEAGKKGKIEDSNSGYKKDDESTEKTEVSEPREEETNVRDNAMEKQPLLLNGIQQQGSRNEGLRKREKRVSFMAAKGGMQVPVAS
ncbi:hypothetical protein SAY86_008989 [Trapa natans]|uniref:Plastid movement impaired protein n=1 Tax=Trapa natans TaxID=22666 RepID=A0AAN7KFR6_TRANT|nr:hypothetical protein SAY86_008989 [Trapa natans]